jgi:hypothetical protein
MHGIVEGGSRRVTTPDPLERVRHALRARARSGAPTPECLDDDTIAALADGTLAPVTRAVVLPHVAGCARCRTAVASVARALADTGVAREVERVDGGRRRFYRIALPVAAAAALLLVLMWPRQVEDGGPLHRAPPITASAVPVPLSPIGTVADAGVLRWTAVAGADRYRVTLSDAGGRVLYEMQVADTVAALPDSLVLVPGRSYVWLVEARIGFDRWSVSRLVEFSVVGPGPP